VSNFVVKTTFVSLDFLFKNEVVFNKRLKDRKRKIVKSKDSKYLVQRKSKDMTRGVHEIDQTARPHINQSKLPIKWRNRTASQVEVNRTTTHSVVWCAVL